MASRGRMVLRLYKEMLREASKFPSYMFRTYSLRRIRDAFREHKSETDAEKIEGLISYAKSNIAIIKRQVIIGQLYSDSETVIEHHIKSGKVKQ